MRIEPTVGRVVHYHPAPDHPDHGQSLTALICKVNVDGTVNLAIFDSCGHQFSRHRVQYANVLRDEYSGRWSWQPHQIERASGLLFVDQMCGAGVEQANAGWIRTAGGAMETDERGVPILDVPVRSAGGSNPFDHYTESPNIPVLDGSMQMEGSEPVSELTNMVSDMLSGTAPRSLGAGIAAHLASITQEAK